MKLGWPEMVTVAATVLTMEGLTGFVLITWSASFTFIEMQRYWDRD